MYNCPVSEFEPDYLFLISLKITGEHLHAPCIHFVSPKPHQRHILFLPGSAFFCILSFLHVLPIFLLESHNYVLSVSN